MQISIGDIESVKKTRYGVRWR